MIRFAIKILCYFNNLSYKIIGRLAIIENKGIHPKHRILNYHKFFLDNISASDKVLDIGCGEGSVSADMAKKARGVVGIDISKKNIISSRKKYFKDNLQFIEGDATTFDFKEKFDVIILSNVLEHIKDRVKFLEKIKKLAPKILIRVPLITRDWISVWKKENNFNYKLDETHFIEYTEESFQKEAAEAGLKIESSYIKFGELYAIELNQQNYN